MRGIAVAVVLWAIPGLAQKAPWDWAPMQAPPGELLKAVQALPAQQEREKNDHLLSEYSVTFHPDGTRDLVARDLYRVRSLTGAKAWGDPSKNFTPWREEQPVLEARLILPDGSVHTHQPEELKDTRPDSSNLATRTVRAPLPRPPETGSVVETVWTTRTKSHSLIGQTSARQYLLASNPVRRLRFSIHAPETMGLKHQSLGRNPAKARVERSGGWVHVTYEVEDFSPIKTEPNRPQDELEDRYVSFGVAQTWQAVASAYSKVIDEQLQGEPMEQIAQKLIGDLRSDDPLVLARSLLPALRAASKPCEQSFGGNPYAPTKPSEVIAGKSACSEDIAALVVGVLRARGHRAFLALHRYQDEDLTPEVPGLGEMQWAVVHLPDAKLKWFDPTDFRAAPGELYSPYQGRKALIISPDTKGLVTLPESAGEKNVRRIKRTLQLAPAEPSLMLQVFALSGELARAKRPAWAVPLDKRKGYFQYDNFNPAAGTNQQMEAFGLSGAEHDARLSGEFQLEKAPNASVGLLGASVKLPHFEIFYHAEEWLGVSKNARAGSDKYAGAGPRTENLLLPVSWVEEVSYEIRPAPGFVVEPLPESQTHEMGAARVIERYWLEDSGTAMASFRFESGPRKQTPDQVMAFREAHARWLKQEPRRIGFEHHASRLIDGGKVSEALKGLEDAVKSEPDPDGLRRRQLAEALLIVNQVDPAQRLLRALVKELPREPSAWVKLGNALKYDTAGRLYGPGWDRAGSIRAFDKALELDEALKDAHAGRADARLRDSLGREYWVPDADIDRAIDDYGFQSGDKWVARRLVDAFIARDRLVGAYRLAKEHDAFELPSMELIEAHREGGPAGLRRLLATMRDRDQQLYRLIMARSVAYQAMSYDLALMLEQEILRVAPGRGSESGVAVATRMKELSEKQIPSSDPLSLVAALIEATLSERFPDGKQLKRLLAHPRATDAELGEMAQAATAPLLQNGERPGLRPQFLIIEALASSTIEVEGDPRSVFRLSFKPHLAADEVKPTSWFVLRDKGGFKLIATDRWPEYAGNEVLRLAKAGELNSARVLLHFVNQAVTREGASKVFWKDLFVELWPDNLGSARRIETAAQLLRMVTGGSDSEQAAQQLLAMRSDVTPDNARLLDARVMSEAYVRMKNPPHAARRWFERLKQLDSKVGGWVELAATRPDDYRARKAALDSLIQLHGEKPGLLQRLATVHAEEGDVEKAIDLYRRALELKDADASSSNGAAWTSLFYAPPSQSTLDLAVKASKATEDKDPSILHTLASVQAEMGKGKEAHETLVRSIRRRGGHAKLESGDHYVLGRISESYGLLESSRSSYQKALELDPKATKNSAAELARRRLAKLPAR
jgi:tetratricopeptide (TPR) repeat protein